MAPLRRLLTEREVSAVKAALPARLKPLMDEVEFVKENCWDCENYDGHEGHPGKCLLHDADIPNDERGKDQPCFVQRITPF